MVSALLGRGGEPEGGSMELTNPSMTLGEFLNTETEDAKQWREIQRIGCAEYVSETNVIWLHVENMRYEVDLDRCKTAKELVDWLFHLAGKVWCKGSVLTDF